VGSGAGAVLGSGTTVGSGAVVGSDAAVASGVRSGMGSVLGVGSLEGVELSVGALEGSAAIVPTGAAMENSSRTTCSPIRIRRRRRKRREAADGPNIDMTPPPVSADPRRTTMRSVMAIAIG